MSFTMANREGNFSEQTWTADIITDDRFTHRLISTITDGKHRLIIRDTDKNLVAEKTTDAHHPMSFDDARNFVATTLQT